MSHDTDKLIRQLSLVAFLMAERRLLTARDVKSNVEGYSEMSDEAFARRFYSDRAELLALGVPLQSQRDEFTGEELYTLRSENYFLEKLELDDDELAALQTALYLLEGQFAYSEPLRLALQNLALGRPGFGEPATETAVRVEVSDPDYSAEMPGRLGKLEGAISKQRTIKFPYYSISRNRQTERSVNPYGLLSDNGSWYVIGQDLDRKDIRTFRVSRIRGDIRFATRRERDFRIPAEFDIDQYRGRPPWQIGDIVGEARIELAGDTAWWVERAFGSAGQLEDGVFVTGYSSLPQLASWILRQDGRAIPVEPDELRREVADALRAVRERHEEAPPKLAAPAPVPRIDATGERPAGPVVPERFAVLQALLAYLLAACGEGHDALIPAQEIVERFHIPAEELEEHLPLLNLVNFGGGCYTVYAAARRRHRQRRQGALRRHVPARAAPDPARSPRHRACTRVRRADDRGRRAHAARSGAHEARRDVRPVRAHADTEPADRRSEKPTSSRPSPRESATAVSWRSSTRRKASRPGRSASSSRTRSSASSRTGACTPGIVHVTPSAASGSTG